MYQTWITCTITNNHNNGSVRLNTRNSSGVSQDNVYALNGNQGELQGDSKSNNQCYRNSCNNNAPFECGYLQLGTPITAKTNYDIGFIWSIQGSLYTSWNGFTTFGNVVTIGTSFSGNTILGVWRVDICIATNATSAMD